MIQEFRYQMYLSIFVRRYKGAKLFLEWFAVGITKTQGLKNKIKGQKHLLKFAATVIFKIKKF